MKSITPFYLTITLVSFIASVSGFSQTTTTTTSSSTTAARLQQTSNINTLTPPKGNRIPINESYPNLQLIYSNPDIFIIKDFLDEESCKDLIGCALKKGLDTSPVAYSGWTQDFKDLLELAAKGPVSWLAIFTGWLQVKDDASASQLALVSHIAQNFVALTGLAIASIGIFLYTRTLDLQSQRTSTSTTLDELISSSSSSNSDIGNGSKGATKFVQLAADLLNDGRYTQRQQAALFEAPTVIRYEKDQVLKPHFDANRSADTEDANRGGQTLATLLVYLNNVDVGGQTRFGKLPAINGQPGVPLEETKLAVQPQLGDALLFFPADAQGNFDEETEHEGCPAVDEKWIARIWRHKERVPPPFGLSDANLAKLS